MLAPIEWKQIAGYPAAAFCVTHDRLVDPIILTDGNDTNWGCPYCVEEQMPPLSAKSKEPERPSGFFNTGYEYEYHQVTFWCSEKKCNYHTTLHEALEVHRKVMHEASDKDKMRCSEGMCDKDAVDFCGQCESAECKDHLDWHNMCPACGSMWPYA